MSESLRSANVTQLCRSQQRGVSAEKKEDNLTTETESGRSVEVRLIPKGLTGGCPGRRTKAKQNRCELVASSLSDYYSRKARDDAGKPGHDPVGQGLRLYSGGDGELLLAFKQEGDLAAFEAW